MLEKPQLLSLRRRGHNLEPVVRLGQHGLTETVLREIDEQLEHHELMKVRVLSDERANRDAMINDICTKLNAELVQRIGHVALLYRRAKPAGKNAKKKNRRGSGSLAASQDIRRGVKARPAKSRPARPAAGRK